MRTNAAKVLRNLSTLAPMPMSDPASDAALLERFIGQRDQAAFSVLVARHGAMVLRLCRRALGDGPDAEDACQATFLVLARKARAIRRPEHLAAWLHGTAYRVARKARARRRPEIAAPTSEPVDPQPDPLTRITARELLTALDEEMARLPETYRLPLILCCLEGRTQEEAARQLGCSAGSVKGRLERGRARLHARLARRGMALSAALLALDAVHGPAAAMPAAPLAATVQAALGFAAGVRDANAGGAAAITLAEGALKSMFITKIKVITTVLLLAIVATAGTASLLCRGEAAGVAGPGIAPPTPPSARSPSQGKKTAEKKAASDPELQGTWVAIAAEAEGKNQPDLVRKGFRLTIEGNRFMMRQETALHFPHGTFTLDASKQPKAIDLTQKYGLPKEEPVLRQGIYALEGATLKLCLAVPGGKRPTDFTTAPGSEREIFLFKRPGAAKEPKECFATREGNTITLHPDNATFRVTDVILNWFNSFKNNLHLSRADLAKVENGAGDWDKEFGRVCNAALPFSCCCAHVSDEGWGKDAVSFADLQVRVYVLDQPFDKVLRRIDERAAAKVKEITKEAAKITSDDEAPWKRRSFSYKRWYGDYGGGATVDFRARQFDGHTVVFAFMYTDYTNQQAKVQAMLQSFTWGAKKRR